MSTNTVLTKIKGLKNWQIAIIVFVIGAAVFSIGVNTPFQGDDISQITTALPVHSVRNIRLFFDGGTFYANKGIAPLSGVYFRPIETVVYSILYTIFEAHSLSFHLVQIFLYTASAFLLYLILCYSLKKITALFASLIFMVQPMNSQLVFAIPSMGDTLAIFFSLLAFWIFLRYKSIVSLVPGILCMFLSILSKETALVLVPILVLYFFWFNRERIYHFIGFSLPLLILYFVMRVHAVGLSSNPHFAQIDSLNLASRLFTTPSILLFFVKKFIFPWNIATGYYWTYKSFSVLHVLVPLGIDIAILVLIVFSFIWLKKRVKKSMFYSYIFFSIWFLLGLAPFLQILPLDMTVSASWFCFSMIGLLAMIGIILESLKLHAGYLLILPALLVGFLSFRTIARGSSYASPQQLYLNDVSTSPLDFYAYSNLATYYTQRDNYKQASIYARTSANIYPSFNSYFTLGQDLEKIGNYSGADDAYATSLKYSVAGNANEIANGIGELTLVYGKTNSDKVYLETAISLYPQDYYLWMYLAILEYKIGDNKDAKNYIDQASQYHPIPSTIYYGITDNHPFTFYSADLGRSISII